MQSKIYWFESNNNINYNYYLNFFFDILLVELKLVRSKDIDVLLPVKKQKKMCERNEPMAGQPTHFVGWEIFKRCH